MSKTETLVFLYLSLNGEIKRREAIPTALEYRNSSPDDPYPSGWYLRCKVMDGLQTGDGITRSFDLKRMELLEKSNTLLIPVLHK